MRKATIFQLHLLDIDLLDVFNCLQVQLSPLQVLEICNDVFLTFLKVHNKKTTRKYISEAYALNLCPEEKLYPSPYPQLITSRTDQAE